VVELREIATQVTCHWPRGARALTKKGHEMPTKLVVIGIEVRFALGCQWSVPVKDPWCIQTTRTRLILSWPESILHYSIIGVANTLIV